MIMNIFTRLHVIYALQNLRIYRCSNMFNIVILGLFTDFPSVCQR